MTVTAQYKLSKAIQDVINDINELSDEINYGHEKAIALVRIKFTELNSSQQALVDNILKLEEAENTLIQIVENLDELEVLIDSAKTKKESVRVSEDGRDIPDYQEWVTNEAKNTLEDEIDSVEAIANKTDVSLGELETAKNQLQDAIEAFNEAIENGKKVTVTTFDQVYHGGKIAVHDGQVYSGLEQVSPGIYNIHLSVEKVSQIFGKLKPGETLQMKLDGQFLQQSNGVQSFTNEGSVIFLANIQNGYNTWTTINPSTIGQLTGSTETHAATIHLVRKHGDALTVVENAIDALPNSEEVNVSHKEAVLAARNAYEALDPEIKLLVYNYNKLVEVEAKLPKNITSLDYYITGVGINESGRLYDIKDSGPLSIELGTKTTEDNLKLRLPREVEVSLDTYEKIKLKIDWNTSDYDGSSGQYNFNGSFVLPAGIENPDNYQTSIQVDIKEFQTDETFAYLWYEFENIINKQAKQAEPYDRVLIEYDDVNMFVNVKINDEYHDKGASEIVFGTGLRTAVMSLLQSEKVVSLKSEGIEFTTLDEHGNKKSDDDLEDDAIEVALSWVPRLSAKMNTYLIYREIEFTLYDVEGQAATYILYFY